jgi:hypothetical protein
MLKLNLSAGTYILDVCENAAKLARHPLAHFEAQPGSWYALDVSGDRPVLLVGPWTKPTDAEESFDGAAFWDYCDSHDMRGCLRVQCVGPKPGVCFDFNDITVECEAVWANDPRTTGDIAQALYEQWEAKNKAADDAYWTPERKAEAERQRVEYEMQMESRRIAVESAMRLYPFQPTCPDAYATYKSNNAEGYGAAVVRYGEGWAALMEAKIADGLSVAEAAGATEHEADYEAITGAMFGFAVRQLVTWWKHGEALRQWHNGQYGHEGPGVVNPAMLTAKAEV